MEWTMHQLVRSSWVSDQHTYGSPDLGITHGAPDGSADRCSYDRATHHVANIRANRVPYVRGTHPIPYSSADHQPNVSADRVADRGTNDGCPHYR